MTALSGKVTAKKIATVAIDESGIDGKPITVGNACSKMWSTLCIF